jgi:hypothetical protein
MQTNIPVHKTSGVKIMLFSMLFVALGFTTFFILKTMYPVEFDNLVGSQEAIHASADTINTGDIIDTSMTGTDTTETTGEDTIDEDLFGELNELETIPQETVPVQTDISRLTTYATQGNAFVVKGKELQNTTIIKYGLYISKKSTAFLEKIANGEEINNLS